MRWFMFTGPWGPPFKRKLKLFIQLYDVHNWCYCVETGGTGYRHVHLKTECTESLKDTVIRNFWAPFHCEPSNDSIKYLRKQGSRFVSSIDTAEVRKLRFGAPRPWQRELLRRVNQQDIRQVTVLVDAIGKVGKSWLSGFLFENFLGYFVPPILSTPKDIIQFVNSGYDGQKYIIIDIPRSWKWSEQLYTAIETIKDGLIFDTRYEAKFRNIRGVKLLVFSNTEPVLSKLSLDRWEILGIDNAGKLFIRNTVSFPLSLDKGIKQKGGGSKENKDSPPLPL